MSTINTKSTMDAPSGQLYELHISQNTDTLHHIRWIDPAGGHTNNTFLCVSVGNNDGLINLPYADSAKIAEIMRTAQELVNAVLDEEPYYGIANELAPMLQEYRMGFNNHRRELYEMLVEDGLAGWCAVGPEDSELFATKVLTGE